MKKRIYFAGVLLLFAGMVDAQSQAETEIKQLFASYMQRYNHYLASKELTHSDNLYAAEIMVISNKAGGRVMSRADFDKQVVQFLDSLAAKGVSQVAWQQVAVQQLDSQLAIASNIANRYDQKGALINQVGATYYLHLQQGQWQINAFSVHGVDGVLPIQVH